MREFRAGKKHVLVATDVAAKGIDLVGMRCDTLRVTEALSAEGSTSTRKFRVLFNCKLLL